MSDDTPQTNAVMASVQKMNGLMAYNFISECKAVRCALELYERRNQATRAALEKIASRGPEPTKWGAGKVGCATCGHWWEPDSALLNNREEHHSETCAYIVAREALNNVPSEGGG